MRLTFAYSIIFLLFSTALFSTTSALGSGYDSLAQQRLTITSTNSSVVLSRTLNNIKAIFDRYKPQIDSSSQVTSPLVVGGTADHPTAKISIRKCVLFICKTVDLDAEFSARDVSGPCDRNAILNADLSRSSSTLTDVYEDFEVLICYKKSSSGQGTLDLLARAKQSVNYSSGIVQKQIYDMLQMQITPIIQAVSDTLEANK